MKIEKVHRIVMEKRTRGESKENISAKTKRSLEKIKKFDEYLEDIEVKNELR
jgi:hypothetical protein